MALWDRFAEFARRYDAPDSFSSVPISTCFKNLKDAPPYSLARVLALIDDNADGKIPVRDFPEFSNRALKRFKDGVRKAFRARPVHAPTTPATSATPDANGAAPASSGSSAKVEVRADAEAEVQLDAEDMTPPPSKRSKRGASLDTTTPANADAEDTTPPPSKRSKRGASLDTTTPAHAASTPFKSKHAKLIVNLLKCTRSWKDVVDVMDRCTTIINEQHKHPGECVELYYHESMARHRSHARRVDPAVAADELGELFQQIEDIIGDVVNQESEENLEKWSQSAEELSGLEQKIAIAAFLQRCLALMQRGTPGNQVIAAVRGLFSVEKNLSAIGGNDVE